MQRSGSFFAYRLFYVCVLVANLLNVIWFRVKPITENQALHAVSQGRVADLTANSLIPYYSLWRWWSLLWLLLACR